MISKKFLIIAVSLVALSSLAQQSAKEGTKSDQGLNTGKSLQSRTLESSVEPSIVYIDGGSGTIGTGVAFENTGDGKSLNSTFIYTTASTIKNRDEVTISYAGITSKVAVKYIDKGVDFAILQAEGTVIPEISKNFNGQLIEGKTTLIGVQAKLGGRISKNRINYVGKRKLSGIEFLEFTGALPKDESGYVLVDEKGSIAGIVSAFRPSSDRVLVIGNDIIKRHSDSFSAAEIIKIIAIDKKFHSNFDDGFARWIAKGEIGNPNKYLDMYEKGWSIFKESGPDVMKRGTEALFEIAKIYYAENSKSTQQVRPNIINLVCEVYSKNRENHRVMSFVINLDESTVDGNKARITQNHISYSYSNPTTYNVEIDRIAGYVVIGTSQFPALVSGNCRLTESKAF